ncbi:MAG: zinc-finger domain-containing protein [Rickettsiella sp.]|nr:zinc-finger domain-containing protein [Rickettsiella sp.]
MSKSLSRSSAKQFCEITAKSLPLSCPLPTNRLWDGHPRVYLPITKTENVTCPYCGTEYLLKDKKN